MYVDDTSIFSSSENPCQLLKDLTKELEGNMDWLRQNDRSLNIPKCEYTFLGNDKKLSTLLKSVIGLTIGESLSWNEQYK